MTTHQTDQTRLIKGHRVALRKGAREARRQCLELVLFLDREGLLLDEHTKSKMAEWSTRAMQFQMTVDRD